MSATELDRLAALEATLVGAAAAQARRRRRRRRRAVLLAAVVAPLALAAAGSIAASGFFAGVDRNLSTLRDDRLQAGPGVANSIAASVGARPRDRQSERTWQVGGQRVIGYSTTSGKFCYIFVRIGGGCILADVLTAAKPIVPTTIYGARIFGLYGLAADSVTSVSVRVHGAMRRVALSHNAFYFESTTLGGRNGMRFTLIAHLRDGTTRQMDMHVDARTSSRSQSHPHLPGALAPLANTAT